MVGSHLAEFLLKQKGIKVFGTYRWRSPVDNIAGIIDRITLIECDLVDLGSVNQLFDQLKPDIIFHLAAQSNVPAALSYPRKTVEVNTIGTLNLLESIRTHKFDPIVHVCSTVDIYGKIDRREKVIHETSPLNPANVYSVSKIGEEMLALQYFIAYGIKTIRSRAITHTGSRRGHVFVESAFAKQIAEIETGKKEPILFVGNLKAVRSFIDVRDMVKAYWLLVNKCRPGEVYNISGGRLISIGDMLDILLSNSPMKDKIKIKVDPKLLRPGDTSFPEFDGSKFSKATGWKPEIKFEKTLKDLLDYWRERIK